MRCRLFSVGVLIGALGAVIWFYRPTCLVNPDSFAKIQNGMHASQVEAILGGPAGDYATRPVEHWQRAYGPIGAQKSECWFGDSITVSVSFDGNDRVLLAEYYKATAKPENILQRVRRWLRI